MRSISFKEANNNFDNNLRINIQKIVFITKADNNFPRELLLKTIGAYYWYQGLRIWNSFQGKFNRKNSSKVFLNDLGNDHTFCVFC